MNTKAKGYLYGSIAAITYGTIPLFTLPLYSEGMGVDDVLFFRYIISIPAVAAMILLRGRSFKVPRGCRARVLLLSILTAMSSLSLFESYNYIDVSIASTLLFIYPLIVALVMAMFFGERIKAATMMCIGTAMCGIFMLLKSPDGAILNPVGIGFVMWSALSYALYITFVNRPALKNVPTLTLIFYVMSGCAVVFLGKTMLSGGGLILPGHTQSVVCLVALALLPTVVSFICTTMSVQCIGPTPTAILGALEPVTAVAIGVWAFNEQLGGREWFGIGLIIISVSLVVAGGRITAPLLRFRTLFPSLRARR